MIRIFIVDDQRLMRDGLKKLLELENDICVVGDASDGREAEQMVLRLASTDVPDVILMDIRMPNQDGITTTQHILATRPGMKILMLTTFDERSDVVGALSAGAVGYLLKDMPAEEIAQSIRVAACGGAVLPPNIAKTFLDAIHQQTPMPDSLLHAQPNAQPSYVQGVRASADRALTGRNDMARSVDGITDREEEVLDCLALGMSNREIAQKLHVTEGTVKNHVSSLLAKLDLRDRTQIALYAVRQGYGQLDDGNHAST